MPTSRVSVESSCDRGSFTQDIRLLCRGRQTQPNTTCSLMLKSVACIFTVPKVILIREFQGSMESCGQPEGTGVHCFCSSSPNSGPCRLQENTEQLHRPDSVTTAGSGLVLSTIARRWRPSGNDSRRVVCQRLQRTTRRVDLVEQFP